MLSNSIDQSPRASRGRVSKFSLLSLSLNLSSGATSRPLPPSDDHGDLQKRCAGPDGSSAVYGEPGVDQHRLDRIRPWSTEGSDGRVSTSTVIEELGWAADVVCEQCFDVE